MLKKVGFGLAILIVLAFAVEPLPKVFERPWHSEMRWPGNSSIVDYSYDPPLAPGWNARILDSSLDALDLPNVEYPYYESAKMVAARSNLSRAKEASKNMESFANYGVLPYFIDVGPACAEFGVLNCTCFVVGTVATCDIPGSRNLRYLIAMRIFSDGYSKGWAGAMDNSLDALEISAKELNGEIASLVETHQTIKYAGLCEQDIAGHDACTNASDFLAIIEANGTSAHSNFTEIRNALEKDERAVLNNTPLLDLSEVINWAGDSSSGEIGRIAALNRSIAEYYMKTKNSYTVLSAEADDLLSKADAANSTAAKDELWRIRAGPGFGDVVGDDTASINSGTSRSAEFLAAAHGNNSQADYAYAYQNQGYLHDAIDYRTSAKALSLQAETSFGEIEQEAAILDLEYESRAQSELNKTRLIFGNGLWPAEATALYNKANAEYGSGQKEGKLGLKFEHFVSAVKYAKEAGQIPVGKDRSTNWSAIADCAAAQDMIARAKKDGIDVFDEEAMVGVLSKTDDPEELLSGCSRIMDGIVEAAKYKYSGIDGERNDAQGALRMCGLDCADLSNIIVEAERGLISHDRVAFPDAIGHLNDLEKEYDYILEKANDSIQLQVSKYLQVRKNFFMASAILDKPTTVRLDVAVVNTVDYPGENLEVDVDSTVPFSQDDIVSGLENLRGAAYLNGKVKLYLKNISARGREEILFERNWTVLKAINTSEIAYGAEDGSALVEDTVRVNCGGDISGFYVPFGWSSLSIDGADVGLEDGYAQRSLAEGIHTLKTEFYSPNAYVQTIYGNSTNLIGQRTYVKYQMQVVPGVDMVYAQILASVPQGSKIKEKRAISLSGEKIDSHETQDGISITIYGLKAGKSSKFEISYYVDNSSSYVEQQILILEALNISNATQEMVDGAMDALARNDTDYAVWKIGQAYEQIAIEDKEAGKLRKEQDSIQALAVGELNEIDSLVGLDGSSYLGEKLIAREVFLQNLLASLDGSGLAVRVEKLKKYDNGWMPNLLKTFKKNASVELNMDYSKYLDMGITNTSVSNLFSDARAAYDEFDVSGSLKDAFALELILNRVDGAVNVLFEQAEGNKQVSSVETQILVDAATTTLKKYTSEYNEAKGSRFEQIFKFMPADIKANLNEVNGVLKKGNGTEITAQKTLANQTLTAELGALNELKNMSLRGSVYAKQSIEIVKNKLSEKDRTKLAALLTNLENYTASEEWVKSLKTSDQILALAAGTEVQGNYDVVVWVSAVFVVAAIIFYYIKLKKPERGVRVFKKLKKAV